MITWPTMLTANAWIGEEAASSAVSTTAKAWTLRIKPPTAEAPLAVEPEDPANWRDAHVGWGIVLLDHEGLTDEERATGADAPESIQMLLKERGNAPVFRYPCPSPYRLTHLRNYASGNDVDINGAPRGLGPDALPQYLLIYGSPAEIPWEFQYVLSTNRIVGRLDLKGDALNNYVQALLNDWKDAASRIEQAVVWAADFGNDITHLMRDAIAAPIYTTWRKDRTLCDTAVFLDGAMSNANAATLIATVSQKKPALIVTTSHGQTSPLSDPEEMKTQLGLPIGQDFHALDPEQLLATWAPDGAIWYAHACCSAGCDATTLYGCVGQSDPALCLMKPGSTIDRVLKGLTGLGALVSPLPRALLGAKMPLRAFIGHVEPTFDWTIQQSATGQFLTSNIQRALYNNIYSAMPIGLAFQEWYRSLAGLYTEYDRLRAAYDGKEDTLIPLLHCQLTARDRQSMVILGDPTVTLPRLP